MLDDAPQKYVMFILRCGIDNDIGVLLEECTRRYIEYKLFNYVGVFYARRTTYRTFELALPDFEDNVELEGFIPSQEAANDISGALDFFGGYNYSPYGPGAVGFGARSPTRVWVAPHKVSPFVFWRHGDQEAREHVEKWFDYWKQQISQSAPNYSGRRVRATADLPTPHAASFWPTNRKEEDREMIIPPSMRLEPLPRRRGGRIRLIA